MSLKPDDRSRRSRSKSPGRERSRSRSNVRAPEAPSAPTAPPYADSNSRSKGPVLAAAGLGSYATSPTYNVRSPASAGAERSGYFPKSSSRTNTYPPPSAVPYPQDDGAFTMGDCKDLPPHERPTYAPPSALFPEAPQDYDDDLAYGDIASPIGSREPYLSSPYPPEDPRDPYAPQPPGIPTPESYSYNPEPVNSNSRSSSYTYQYAQPPQEITYTTKPQTGATKAQYTQSGQGQYQQLPRNYGAYDQGADIVDITPGKDKPDRKSAKSSKSKSVRLSVDTRNSGGLNAPRSPGMTGRMDRLSVSGNRPDLSVPGSTGGLPPPSPMLEAYHGTYQQISPMPLAMRMDDDDELDDLEPLSPQAARSANKDGDRLSRDAARQKEKKRVMIYSGEEDAKSISQALGRSRIDSGVICDILPGLSHDNILELRKEYKKQVKVQGKGVNLSKHLKTKLAGNFGKAAYVTALGKWESEGYWANFFYQSHKSRSELLVESLMGRSNADIWYIKDDFKDKRYADDLEKCMQQELKPDKFRTAVLMVLEQRRQEEQDVYPIEYRNRDVDTLHKALTARQGGESAMLEIVVRRSDAHLREVLKTYERMYQESFAHAALKRSPNLVGEVITHILNGVINKPARDALLLRHAIKDIHDKNQSEELRYELLISRLVRIHWDKAHLEKVKAEYRKSNKKHLETDIEEATKGDFYDFLYMLCQTR